jgi:hypothetical protein
MSYWWKDQGSPLSRTMHPWMADLVYGPFTFDAALAAKSRRPAKARRVVQDPAVAEEERRRAQRTKAVATAASELGHLIYMVQLARGCLKAAHEQVEHENQEVKAADRLGGPAAALCAILKGPKHTGIRATCLHQSVQRRAPRVRAAAQAVQRAAAAQAVQRAADSLCKREHLHTEDVKELQHLAEMSLLAIPEIAEIGLDVL